MKKKVSFSGRRQSLKIVHVLVDIFDRWILLFNVKWAATSLTQYSLDVQDIWPHQCYCSQWPWVGGSYYQVSFGMFKNASKFCGHATIRLACCTQCPLSIRSTAQPSGVLVCVPRTTICNPVSGIPQGSKLTFFPTRKILQVPLRSTR